MASVYIPSPLRRLTNGQGRADVPARSIRELLDGLEGRFPGIKAEVCDERGEVRSYINTFINGTEIRQLAGLDTPLADTDEVSIIPAMAGGREKTGSAGTRKRGHKHQDVVPPRDSAIPQVGESGSAAALTDQIFTSIVDVVGHTPIVRLNRVARGVRADVVAKLEFLNPGGSVKDRIGITMIEEAERAGVLRPGGTIVEATSGNTGVGLAIAAAIRGYRTIFVMPDKMSDEKIRLLRAFGARVVITPTAVAPEDPRSYYSVSRRLAQETPNSFYANQYANQANPRTHYQTTGPEIWTQTAGRVDVLVVGMGTGGTISGAGRYLKERNPALRVVGADPIGSVYYEYVKTGRMPEAHAYKVEGIGEDFLPETMDLSVVDEVIQVSDGESFAMTRALVREEGIFCGGSSGTAVAAAVKFLKTQPDAGAGLRAVVILPDSGARYLSKIFSDDWMREHGFLKSALGAVADLLAGKAGALVTATRTDAVIDVIAKMKQYDVSQLPVLDGGRLMGMISEVDLLNYLLEGSHRASDPVETIVDPLPPVVEPDTPLDALADVFLSANAAVVVDHGVVAGIVTKIDMIDFLAKRRER